MNLNQYACYRHTTSISGLEEFHYWKNHYNLHNWMESLWKSKGNDGIFNCECLDLSASDIDALELHITQKDFYTEDWQMEEDLKFIRKAREVLDNGLKIVYDSWL